MQFKAITLFALFGASMAAPVAEPQLDAITDLLTSLIDGTVGVGADVLKLGAGATKGTVNIATGAAGNAIEGVSGIATGTADALTGGLASIFDGVVGGSGRPRKMRPAPKVVVAPIGFTA